MAGGGDNHVIRNCLQIANLLPIDLGIGNHQIGTTRMSASPKEGVVDPNGRVHGVGNLYVLGSSVFPTGGAANPTLTIIAMALRMSDWFKQEQLETA